MFKVDKNQGKTPLEYYEIAIEELRRGREELQDIKDVYLQNVNSLTQSLNSEIQQLKDELKNTHEKLVSSERKTAEIQTNLLEMQKTASDSQQKLEIIQEGMIDERNMNNRIIEDLAQINEKLSQITSPSQAIVPQTEILGYLSNLQLQLSHLSAELTLVSHMSGIDYRNLQQLLTDNKWQEADQETYIVILKICDRSEEGWLDDREIKTLPRQDLEIINKLWVKHSQGKFGFSVQKNIWQAKKDYKHFAYRVGWLAGLANTEWLKYGEYNFSLDSSKGHLPSTSRLVGLDSRNVGEVAHRIKIFLSRY
ncbi:MAG TPA: GUN4 domain-containing protein [Trichormus sp. M33_DOE_039]|nr:GUN4 domain-containing protein [Trichormus sp. M33_DOE_039]